MLSSLPYKILIISGYWIGLKNNHYLCITTILILNGYCKKELLPFKKIDLSNATSNLS